jgi:hypothetical protein
MSEQNVISKLTVTNNEASADIEQYRVVCVDTTDNEGGKLPAAVTSPPLGISQAHAAAGETVALAYAGISYVTVAAAVTRGDTLIISGTAGKVASKGISTHTSGTAIIGTALKSATTDGNIIPVLLTIGSQISS